LYAFITTPKSFNLLMVAPFLPSVF